MSPVRPAAGVLDAVAPSVRWAVATTRGARAARRTCPRHAHRALGPRSSSRNKWVVVVDVFTGAPFTATGWRRLGPASFRPATPGTFSLAPPSPKLHARPQNREKMLFEAFDNTLTAIVKKKLYASAVTSYY